MARAMVHKHKRGRPATGKGEFIGVRLHADLLGPLEAWIADQPEPKPSRPEAIRGILRSHLSLAKTKR